VGRTKKNRIYADSCVIISWIMGEERPNLESQGVRVFFNQVTNGEVILVALRNVIFDEVQIERNTEATMKFRNVMARGAVELPSQDIRIERLATQLRDYYIVNGPKELKLKDSLHLATTIHNKCDAFYTFDDGQKGGISLLSLNGNVAGYHLVICKPPITQYSLF
jgi:predicted nucleic acid-binding protein